MYFNSYLYHKRITAKPKKDPLLSLLMTKECPGSVQCTPHLLTCTPQHHWPGELSQLLAVTLPNRPTTIRARRKFKFSGQNFELKVTRVRPLWSSVRRINPRSLLQFVILTADHGRPRDTIRDERPGHPLISPRWRARRHDRSEWHRHAGGEDGDGVVDSGGRDPAGPQDKEERAGILGRGPHNHHIPTGLAGKMLVYWLLLKSLISCVFADE